ncbi:hypothetical protein MKW94_028237, partial [Papaver nudicaule]|nr:hypothetical protein [Papaver nudicaule]
VAIGNAIIDMYAKCGCLNNSRLVFENMNDSSVVTWTTLISSYGVNGKGEESVTLFEEMIAEGFKPNCNKVGWLKSVNLKLKGYPSNYFRNIFRPAQK